MLLKFYLSTRIFKDDLAILLDNLAAIDLQDLGLLLVDTIVH